MSKKKASSSARKAAQGAKKKTTKTGAPTSTRKVEAIARKHNLLPRQHQLLDAIASDAAGVTGDKLRAAGYSERSARHPGEVLGTQRMRAAMAELLAPIEKIAETINAGLDAIETETFVNVMGSKLKGTEHVELQHVDKIAWTERRQYAALAAKLKGLEPGVRVEHEGEVTTRVIVEYEAVGA